MEKTEAYVKPAVISQETIKGLFPALAAAGVAYGVASTLGGDNELPMYRSAALPLS